MNKVIIMGRLARDPDIRYTQDHKCVAKYTLAVDRYGKDAGADFISCVSFEKTAEFVEKYLKKGTKILAEGSIITGSYTNRDGNKVYTTDVRVSSCEFAESKRESQVEEKPSESPAAFMDIPEGADEELPFN